MREPVLTSDLTHQLDARLRALGEAEGAAGASDLLHGAMQDLAAAGRALRARDEALFAARVGLDQATMWYRELFEGLPTATLVTTPCGRVTHANTAACLLARRPLNGVVGRPLAALVPAPDRRAFDVLLARARATAHVADVALWIAQADLAPVDCRAWVRTIVTLGPPSPVLVWTLAPLLPAF